MIEYKFKFEKNGFTLTQQIEPGASDSKATGKALVEANALKASFEESKQTKAAQPKSGGGPNGEVGSGGGPNGEVGSGGGGFGTAPVTIIGPFVMCCPHEDSKKEGKE